LLNRSPLNRKLFERVKWKEKMLPQDWLLIFCTITFKIVFRMIRLFKNANTRGKKHFCLLEKNGFQGLYQVTEQELLKIGFDYSQVQSSKGQRGQSARLVYPVRKGIKIFFQFVSFQDKNWTTNNDAHLKLPLLLLLHFFLYI